MGGAVKLRPLDYAEKNGYVRGVVREMIHDPGRGAPIVKVQFNNPYKYKKDTYQWTATEGTYTGQFIYCGKKAQLIPGNILPLEAMPPGTVVNQVEKAAGDRSKYARTSGGFAQIIGHIENTGKTRLRLPSGQKKLVSSVARAAVAVKDPEKLSAALGGLYTSWLAVQAVLRIEFAKTITLGVSIAAMATPYLQKVSLPVLVHVMPPAYHHWIPMVIANAARSIGVAVAWKMQEIVSVVHLALLGGLLFSRSLLRWARHQGYVTIAAEDTVLDEVVGYAVAALGFYYQYTWGFALPFPLSLLFFPLGWVEWYIRWAITSTVALA